ncbi:MAG: diguanylate cyclase [Gallionella sp.]|nr:diguanylate cyclase [Gallionella sp.]MDD4960208.1 diguanylate cyclase [Gallionella sp.]
MRTNRKSLQFVSDWNALANETPAPVKTLISTLIQEHAVELSDLFYQSMLTDADAKSFLSHELVNSRLHASMQAWLLELFAVHAIEPAVIYQHQRHVGEVHARLQIPVILVLRGSRLLKQKIYTLLVASPLERGELISAINFVNETMQMTMDVMTDAFVIDMEKHAREDESYRMFALGSNMPAERERQRAALLEWAQHILLALLNEPDERELRTIQHSEFGLWLEHKASIVFRSAPELEQIKKRIAIVEQSISQKMLVSRQDKGDARILMKEIEAGVAEIKFLLGGLFDRFIEVESGRDALTRLLNRQHMPSVLSRELVLARRTGMPFSLLMIDIDHFKQINDAFGHDGGDLVLQQAAELITSNIRAGDFVFRFGGEEILILLVEVEQTEALKMAEIIRQRFVAEPFRVNDLKRTPVTVSIGIATYDGHPDYQTVIKDADSALYRAKHAGRNCCITTAS